MKYFHFPAHKNDSEMCSIFVQLQCTSYIKIINVQLDELQYYAGPNFHNNLHKPWCESPPVVIANLHSVLPLLPLLELLHLLFPGLVDVEHEERTRVVLCNLKLIK